ncbi:hypothetical protein HYV43_04060 [Candidatus Micrarchaeota archaeon]|nr:hypothetical protein [Candidatus Micrarchaeota archaeon]
MRGWILVSLLLFASAFIAAASNEDTQVAAAVGAALGTDPTPAPTAGFIEGRLGDIQKRVEPMARKPRQTGPAYGPKGPNFGPDYGYGDKGQDFGPDYDGGPGFGGPQFGPDDGYGPKDDFGPGFGKPQDGGFQPGPYGPSGPGPQGGPGGFRDFRGFGGFDLPPEAIEHMIFNKIGTTMEEKYGKEKLMAQCNNQPALVGLVLEEFQKTGINLEQEICSEIEDGLSFCAEAKEQCEQIGGEGWVVNGPDGQEEFKPTCPPDENQWKQMCVERMKSEFDRNLAERLEDAELQCNERWQFDRPPDDACKDGKPRQPMECDKAEWISQCQANMPPEDDWGPGPENNYAPGTGPNGQPGQPYGPPNNQPGYPPQGQPNGQPYQPPQNMQCPPMDENAKNQCLASGQGWTTYNGPNGCPYIGCMAPQQPPTAPPAQPTPVSTPTLEQPPQPTATTEPTPAPTAPPAEPTAQPSVQAAAAPYSGFVTGRMSAAERCEQDWNRQASRFAQRCQSMQQRNKGPQFNYCNEQEFLAQCKAESQKNMERDKQRMNPDRICAQQIKRDIKHFERYCKDTARGKEQCIRESEKGCEFGKKQLARCKELTQTDSIKKAIERAVARECRARNGPSGDRYGRLNDYVSDDYRPVIDYVSDDLTQSDETLSEAERKERDLLYQLFRTNKDNVEQAKKFKESKEKLDASIKNLESLRESVSEDKRSQFDEEIVNIKKRRDEAEQSAQALEKGSEGILSFITKLFGG